MKFFSLLSYTLQWAVIGAIVGFFSIFGYLYFTGIPKLIPYVILSGSMEPEIPVGSVVIVQPQHIYTPGDVITFKTNSLNNTFVTHRIISVDRKGVYFGDPVYKTRGDANKSADSEMVKPESIQGKAVLTIPFVGYAVNYIKTPKGFLFFVIVPATIIIYEEVKNIKRELLRIFIRSKEKQNRSFLFLLLILFIPLATSISFAVVHSGSFFKDAETSIGSVIGAASSFAKEESIASISATQRGGDND
jgi:signal peptidase